MRLCIKYHYNACNNASLRSDRFFNARFGQKHHEISVQFGRDKLLLRTLISMLLCPRLLKALFTP